MIIKGFNYKNNILEIADYFEILGLEGTKFPLLPLYLSANIGVCVGKGNKLLWLCSEYLHFLKNTDITLKLITLSFKVFKVK